MTSIAFSLLEEAVLLSDDKETSNLHQTLLREIQGVQHTKQSLLLHYKNRAVGYVTEVFCLKGDKEDNVSEEKRLSSPIIYFLFISCRLVTKKPQFC